MGPDCLVQRKWDDGVCSARAEGLLQRADKVNRARLLTSVAPGSGSWLNALPRANLGLRLGNQELRIAVGLRVGTPLVRPHRCVCGAEVTQAGTHDLACRLSAGRHRRRALANDVIVRSIRSMNSRRPAFSAAMEGGPIEPPSIPGPMDNTLCETSLAQKRLPRRTLTSLHWRQDRQHLRRSHGSAPSMQSCPQGTMPSFQSRSRPLGMGTLCA